MPLTMLPPPDSLSAYALQLDGQYYLARGAGAPALAALGQDAFSPVSIRYAFPHFATRRPFFPALAADDRGRRYRGLEAIDWLSSSGLLFPRADALGVWSDGVEDQLFIKELDLAVPMLSYAAPSEAPADFPGHLLAAAIEIVENTTFALAPGGNFPIRLLSAIPALQLNAASLNSRTARLIPQVAANPRTLSFADLEGDFLP